MPAKRTKSSYARKARSGVALTPDECRLVADVCRDVSTKLMDSACIWGGETRRAIEERARTLKRISRKVLKSMAK